eukprot:TRINITY_DN21198_c0_g1_i1.p2 TRINITY_DN21198_c0_g1~~TRINITY_DN21198_c0_g1_i1.p2  ORF type:complete len:258 (-),score=27.70 TRINITY_DN21198_c0_g1_i1:300-1016(-)
MVSSKKLKFVVTGFNSFSGVDDNPSGMLAQEINSNFARMCGQDLELAVILNVAAADVKQWIVGQQHKMANKELLDGSHVVWLHLGVDTTRNQYSIETRAINNATFRCPDNKDWCPKDEKINAEQPLTSHLYTDLDVEQITACLQLRGFNVDLSDSAGKYVCNWTYYLSLQDSNLFPGRWHSLFVHVPTLEEVSLDKQKSFLKSLIEVICMSFGCADSVESEINYGDVQVSYMSQPAYA